MGWTATRRPALGAVGLLPLPSLTGSKCLHSRNYEGLVPAPVSSLAVVIAHPLGHPRQPPRLFVGSRMAAMQSAGVVGPSQIARRISQPLLAVSRAGNEGIPGSGAARLQANCARLRSPRS